MIETKYGIIEAAKSLPSRDLIRVRHLGRPIVVSLFGLGKYNNNLAEMQREYSCNPEFPRFTCEEPTTSKSISAIRYDIKEAKKKILDPSWLQAGRIVETQEGFFTNTIETDESKLKKMLNGVEKTKGGIYLINDKIVFAPYDSFRTGVQDSEEFARSGLALALEHSTEKVAPNLKEISSNKFYPNGVNVLGFEAVKEPVVGVVSLGSDWGSGSGGLVVGGDDWDGDSDGHVFGCVASGDAQTFIEDRRYSLESIMSALTAAGIEGESQGKVIAGLPANIV